MSGPAPAAPAGPVGRPPARGRVGGRLQAALPPAALVLLVVAVGVVEPSFLTVPRLRTLLEGAAPILLLALGQTFVILLGGIDLSSAALASLGTVLLGLWLPDLGVVGVLGVLLATTVAGALSGAVCAVAQVPSFVVTLGAMGLWGGVALTISGASTITIVEGYDAIAWVRDLRLAGVPAAAVIGVVGVLVAAVLIRTLARGRSLHAVGLGERAALMSGVRTRRVRVLAFALSGLCAGLAAVVLAASQFSGGPTLADSLLLPSIAAVIVGGTAITGGVGGPLRTLVGALVVVVLRVGLSVVGVDPSYEQIVYGAVIVLAVALTLDRRRLGVVK